MNKLLIASCARAVVAGQLIDCWFASLRVIASYCENGRGA